MGILEDAVLSMALVGLVFHFFQSLRFYFAPLCLLAGVVLCFVLGSLSDGRLLLATTLFFCLGVASASLKKVYFFPVKAVALPLGVWVVGFLLLNVAIEFLSGFPDSGFSIKSKMVATVCGGALGAIGVMIYKGVVKQYGAGVNRFFLLDTSVWPVASAVAGARRAVGPSVKPTVGAGSTVIPPKTVGSSQKDDVKKSILDAKLAAMCGGADAKPGAAAVPSKSAVPSSSADAPAQKSVPKATTETGKIVSSVDFS